jgi:hypothetical protein
MIAIVWDDRRAHARTDFRSSATSGVSSFSSSAAPRMLISMRICWSLSKLKRTMSPLETGKKVIKAVIEDPVPDLF